MKKVKLSELKEFSVKSLIAAGLSEEDANTAAEALVTTDTFGVLTHGTKNFNQYIQKMAAGGLDAKAEPKIAEILEGKTVIKEIYVPGKIVNIVAK